MHQDGAQINVFNYRGSGMPPPNMQLWHTDYFELKAREKQQVEERALLTSLSVPESRG